MQSRIPRVVFWTTLAVAVIGLAAMGFVKAQGAFDSDSAYNFDAFARLTVSKGGRVKPIDSYARNTLDRYRGRQTALRTVTNDQGQTEEVKKPAIVWYLNAVTGRNEVDQDQIFRIDHPAVFDALSMEQRDSKYYSYNDLAPHLPTLLQQYHRAATQKAKQRNPYEKQIVKLTRHVIEYRYWVQGGFEPHFIPPVQGADKWQRYRRGGRAARQVAQAFDALGSSNVRRAMVPRLISELSKHLNERRQLVADWDPAGGSAQPNLPQGHPNIQPTSNAASNSSGSSDGAQASLPLPVKAWQNMLEAYQNQKPQKFNDIVGRYLEYQRSEMPGEMRRAGLELMAFNRFGPFYVGSMLCVGIFLLGCLSWLIWMKPFRNAALALTIVTGVLLTLGMIGRIYIQMRPPVTNLYSSAIFVAWGLVLMGIVLDVLFKNSIGLVATAIGGFTSLVLAQNLAEGDTMGVMQAVLDTNFWLATHVTTVTMGYVATFAAGLLGIILIGLGVVASGMSDAGRRDLAGSGTMLARMIYGVVCFALLLSFVGTVLGGMWADYSWGRFWGWDPKENGAAIIVLMNALILHARWGGMVKERGLAVLAVVGNIVTAWSWFGTNMLGVGLHSYGFMNSAPFWMGTFVLSQMAIIAVGLMPLEIWHGSELMKSPRRVEREYAKRQAGEPSSGGAAMPPGPTPAGGPEG